MNIVEKMRADRKSPNILRLKVLKIRGEQPEIFIFIHEGVEDISVYEAWLARIGNTLAYEPIPGAGKEQVLGFYHSVRDEGLSKNIAFFVDRDFDKEISDELKNIFELPAYSIENYLCTREVIDSILKDEFYCAGSIAERQKIVQQFEDLQSQFRSLSEPVNFLMFAARRENAKVIKKPDSAVDIAKIHLCSVECAYNDLSTICEIECVFSDEKSAELRNEFEKLSPDLKNRGKYEFDLMRRWLRILDQDKKSAKPELFLKSGKVQGDPSLSSMRRFAIAGPLPLRLAEFIEALTKQPAVESPIC